MKRRYEILLALNTRGKEDSAKDVIERIEKELTTQGVSIEQVQRLERRELAYKHNKLTSAYYVNFVVHMEPTSLQTVRAKFKLDPDIALQNYLLVSSEAKAVAKSAA